MSTPDSGDVYHAAIDQQLTAFIDRHRDMLLAALDGVSETEARARLVPSKTTLLGLIKHGVMVERVWFGEAVTGTSRTELGVAETPDESFDLTDEDTIDSVRAAYRDAVELSHRACADLTLDDVLPGNRRGPLPLRWVYLHVLRELAQHCGHADIIREQILARRAAAG